VSVVAAVVTRGPDPRWEAFAAREPHFAVLTAPRFLQANLTPAAEREFFDSGEALVDWTLRTIELRLAPEFAPMTTLEFGCGIGRLAIPFARRPGVVTAVDRSPAMLDRARREAERQGVMNIDFRTPAALFAAPRKFDLVNCYLVFQRMPQAEGLPLLDTLVGCLGAGGIGVFHFPYRTTTSPLLETSRRLRRVPAINAVANLLRGKPVGEPFIASYAYNLHDVLQVLDDRSIESTHVAFEHHEGLAFATIFVQAPSRDQGRRGAERLRPASSANRRDAAASERGWGPASREESRGWGPASREESRGWGPASREESRGWGPASREESHAWDPASREESHAWDPASREESHWWDPATSEKRQAGETSETGRPIDVRELIARTSIDDLNRTAEQYFASLADWEHHLAKPFSKPDETPPLLIDVATVLQGLRLTPGATVLEFGAGTGWLSRFLTQLGCRVILLDVSPTALRIARELYERLPIIGDRPAPQFLPFDGRHIDVPDGSVERILSFHAFHHAANPDAVLREFGRILTTGGIAGFAEPGPRHSRRPLSQFEMRTYGVVENDVDVHAIWRTAQTCGFTDMKLMVFHAPPFHVSLEEYEDFLTGGPVCAKWVTLTRGFLRHVRSFLLFKEGTERADSRSVTGLACDVSASLVSAPALEGEPLIIDVTVTNSGAAPWLSSDAEAGGVMLGAHLYDAAGKLLHFDVAREPLAKPARETAPGETVRCRLTVPPQQAGRYTIEVDCVAARVTWFAQIGSRPATLPVDVQRVRRTSDR
jgi:SAM-dependent methyltransferase